MEVIELAITVLVFFLMFVIGASLEKRDVNEIKAQSDKVLMLTLGQIILLPLCAWIIIVLMQPPPLVAGGMFLISLCPGGAVSNIYSFLAKANVALSVTLTAFNGLLAVFILPLVMITVFPALLSVDLALENLMIKQALQLVLLLLFPVVLGMTLRYWQPVLIQKLMPLLEKKIWRSRIIGLIDYYFGDISTKDSSAIIATDFISISFYLCIAVHRVFFSANTSLVPKR